MTAIADRLKRKEGSSDGNPPRQPWRRRLDGVVPDNVSDMARDVLRFVEALPLREI
jgi:hypothetical protein